MVKKRDKTLVFALLLTAAFSFRVTLVRALPNDDVLDSQVYSQIARNLIEQGVFSQATEPPFKPTLASVPGYPLFLAGVYSIAGSGNDTAVRIVQALVDTVSCGLIALLAFFWEPNQKLKRRSAIGSLALAAFCPFTAIYVTTILSETLAIFFVLASFLTATLAFQKARQKNALLYWVATGVLLGIAVQFRPDSGLFALAIGLTLVITLLTRSSELQLTRKSDEILYRFSRASVLGAVLSLAFCVALVPWTVRNYRTFQFIQPLAPRHAALTGDFVPRGYLSWLRTWVDDGRHIGPVFWSLNQSPIELKDIPNSAFDSAEEKQRVGALLDRYNHPPRPLDPFVEEEDVPMEELESTQPDDGDTPQPADEPATAEEDADEGAETTQGPETSAPDGEEDQLVLMTPEIDAGFARIAQERIERRPVHYYAWLPAKRASSLWFDTHSQFYPFEGELLPLSGLDREADQHIWLPFFAGLTLLYTILSIGGGWVFWRADDPASRRWLLLVVLIVFLRLAYFSTLENPESRYMVELFPFASVLGGIALAGIFNRKALKRRPT